MTDATTAAAQSSRFPVGLLASHTTPFYAYDTRLLADTLAIIAREAGDPAWRVEYAIKANPNPGLLRMISAAGLGADCVSGGEIALAISCGFPAESITFAGVGKTDAEIIAALEAGIGCFNVESVEELEVISSLAAIRGLKAPVALRINPDIDAHTHHYITTGLAENKFGISLERLDEAVDAAITLEGVELKGIHFHIGSQVLDMAPYALLCERIEAIVNRLEERGISLSTINVGGGLGIDYDNPDAAPIADFAAYFATFRKGLRLRPGQHLHFELGRAVVAQCGSLITRVTYVKHGLGKDFVIVDAGMTDLIRPALYGAHHHIDNLTPGEGALRPYDVVGPVCESSDTFDTAVMLPPTRRGDLLAIRSAGAYGEAMASGYNCRPLPGSLLF